MTNDSATHNSHIKRYDEVLRRLHSLQKPEDFLTQIRRFERLASHRDG